LSDESSAFKSKIKFDPSKNLAGTTEEYEPATFSVATAA